MGLLKDFKYHAPATVQEALRLLQKSSSPLILAGGTFGLNYLKKSAKYPADVIVLRKITALKGVREEKKGVSIGAMTTIAELLVSDIIKKNFPSLSCACQHLATTPVRNMATIGGNVASRFYWVDLPAVLISLGAQVSLLASGGRKAMAVEDFLRQKPPAKFILTSFFLPKKGLTSLYFRHTKAMAVDVPSLALAFSASAKGSLLKGVRLVVNTATSFPVELKSAEAVLEGREISKISFSALIEALNMDLKEAKLDEYRRHCLDIDLESLVNFLNEHVTYGTKRS
jgi:CO/xanthine dehydrogenase FAD-binding subunit